MKRRSLKGGSPASLGGAGIRDGPQSSSPSSSRGIVDVCSPEELERLRKLRELADAELKGLPVEEASALAEEMERAENAVKKAESVGIQAAAVDLAVAQSEFSKASSLRAELERRCRSLQGRNKALAQEASSREERDKNSRAEREGEFSASLQNIREQLKEQMILCEEQKAENADLHNKLEAFKSTLSLREDHWAASRRASALELQLWEGKAALASRDAELLKSKLFSLGERRRAMEEENERVESDTQAVMKQLECASELIVEGRKRIAEDEKAVESIAMSIKQLETENLALKRQIAGYQIQVVKEVEASKTLGVDPDALLKSVKKLRSLCNHLEGGTQRA